MIRVWIAAMLVLAAVGGVTATPAGGAATHLPGAGLPVPKYPGGLTAGYCVGLGMSSWGPFRSRTDAEVYAGRLPFARAAALTWCPIRP
jgi:hypothetical protein